MGQGERLDSHPVPQGPGAIAFDRCLDTLLLSQLADRLRNATPKDGVAPVRSSPRPGLAGTNFRVAGT